MIFRKTEKLQFTLAATEIDRFSAWLEENLQKARADRKNRLRFRLSAEEILLRLQAQFGDDTAVNASLERGYGKTRLQMEFPGAAFNPLSESGDRFGEWNSFLLSAVGMEPKYAYVFGKNHLRLFLPARKMNPVILIAIAILIGCLLGYGGKFLLTEAVRSRLVDVYLQPVYDVWFRILNALSGPVIFFTSMTTILNTGEIRKNGSSRTYVLGRYFVLSLLCAGVAALGAAPFFYNQSSTVQLSDAIIRREFETILSTIPNSIVAPFSASDTPQLLFLAFTMGGALSVLGERAKELRKLILQINMAGLMLAKWVSRLVPVFTSVFLVYEIWLGNTSAFRHLWKPLTVFTAISFLIMLAAFLFLSAVTGVRFSVAVKKCLPPFWSSLKRGAIDDAALEETESVCVKRLGIDGRFTKVSLPQGTVLYMPVSSVGVLIFTMYAALKYSTHIDPLHLFFAILLVVILFVATPPVPGANLLAYIALFSWLGIPEAALVNAMIFDIIAGIAANAGNLTLLEIETVFQARRIGLMDPDKLKKPLE